MTKSINRRLAELVTATGDIDNSSLTNVTLLDSADVVSIGNNTSSGTQVFDTLDSLPTSSLNAGQQAFVNANQRLYISNGTGWYNLTFVNKTPTWLTEPDATYDIADSATPLIVTAKAQDSDNSNIYLLNQSVVTDSAQYMVNISNDSSVFTFAPKSADSIGIEVAAGNLTDSNGDFVYTFKWSDGINFVSKAVTIGYSPAGAAGGIYGTRGILFNASSGSGNNSDTIEYFDISGSTGITAIDFGNLIEQSGDTPGSAVTNATRGVYQVYTGSGVASRQLQYVTISTLGNAASFGEFIVNSSSMAAWHNGTYGYFARQGGSGANIFAVITVDTEANATATGYTLDPNFLHYGAASAGDDTRMLVAGGETNGGLANMIQYITMPMVSNASDFGTLSFARRNTEGTGDDTYSVWGGGWTTGSIYSMDYVTTQTTSNSSSFGSLSAARNDAGAVTDGSRGCWIGGYNNYSTSRMSTIDYVTISTPGNAVSFGNMTAGGNHVQGVSGNAA